MDKCMKSFMNKCMKVFMDKCMKKILLYMYQKFYE